MATLLGMSSSLRQASTNTMPMRYAATIFDADTFIEADIRLPLYDGDLEAAKGIPAAVQKFADPIAVAGRGEVSAHFPYRTSLRTMRLANAEGRP